MAELALPTLVQRIRLDTSQLSRAMGQVRSSIREVGQSISDLGSRMQAFGTTMSLAVSAPIAGAMAAATSAIADADRGLREVVTLLDLTGRAAERELGVLRREVVDVAREIGQLPSDVIPALYQAISAGVPRESVFDFMRVAGRLAKVGVTDLETAVDGLTTIINAWGLSMDDVARVADILFSAVQGGKTTVEQFSNFIFQAGLTAANVGVAIEEIAAALATLTAQGVPTAESMTRIRAAIVALARPNEALTEIFRKHGFESAQAAIRSRGLVGALQIIRQEVGDNAARWVELLGSVEAFDAAQALTGKGAKKFVAEMERIADNAGVVETQFGTMNRGIADALTDLKVEVEAARLALGEMIAPTVQDKARALADTIRDVVDWLKQLPEDKQRLIVGLAGALAAAGPGILALGTALKVVGAAVSGLSVLLSPVGLAVAGLAAAGLLIAANWETIEPVVRPIVDRVRELADDLLPRLRDVWERVADAGRSAADQWRQQEGPVGRFRDGLGRVGDGLRRLADLAKGPGLKAVGDMLGRLRDAVVNIGDAIRERLPQLQQIGRNLGALGSIIGPIVDMLGRLVTSFAGPAWEHAQRLWTNLRDLIGEVGAILKGLLDFVVGVMSGDWKVAWEGIAGVVSGAWGIVREVLQTAWSTFQTIVEGVDNFLGGPFSKMGELVSTVFQGIVDWVKNLPSKLSENVEALATAATGIGKTILNGIIDAISGAIDAGKRGLSTLADAVTGLFRRVWNTVVGLLETGIRTALGLLDKAAGPLWNIDEAQVARDVTDRLRIAEPKRRAVGGPVMAGVPTLVGERGPELVMPRQPGWVLPASDTRRLLDHLAARAGGVTIQVSAGERASAERIAREIGWQLRVAGVA